MLRPVVERADELLAQRGQHPLPRGVTPHKLRHTFASVLVALGRDPRYVMDQLGHADPNFTMSVYTHAMRFDDDERARLRAFVEGVELAAIGTGGANDLLPARSRSGLPGADSAISRASASIGAAGFEPATSCSQSRRAARLRHAPSGRMMAGRPQM